MLSAGRNAELVIGASDLRPPDDPFLTKVCTRRCPSQSVRSLTPH